MASNRSAIALFGMLRVGSCLRFNAVLPFFSLLFTAIVMHMPIVASVAAPRSTCYTFDNSSHLVDFTDWIGHTFEYDGKDSDIVVRFCKDIESRSQAGYVDFGRYEPLNYFLPGQGPVDFVQEFYGGDLENCEQSFDKMGRTAQVNVVCGSCMTGACKGELGCICSVTYDSTKCRVTVELAIQCAKQGPHVFKGFTVGFHPRSWEIVYDGLTQLGFEKRRAEFSFGTEQTSVALYLTAVSAVSDLVGKPSFVVNPNKGLEVKISGSAASGKSPTTLSPTVLDVNWRCEVPRATPYAIELSIPIKGYDTIEFTLTKSCEYTQGTEDDAMTGWATFGVLMCIFIVLSTILCCGGFIYKSRVEHQHGLDALPGMTLLSACLEAASGPRGYRLGESTDGNFTDQASWEATPSAQGKTTNETRYGSI